MPQQKASICCHSPTVRMNMYESQSEFESGSFLIMTPNNPLTKCLLCPPQSASVGLKVLDTQGGIHRLAINILLCFSVKSEVNAVFQSQTTNRKLITTVIEPYFKENLCCSYIIREGGQNLKTRLLVRHLLTVTSLTVPVKVHSPTNTGH